MNSRLCACLVQAVQLAEFSRQMPCWMEWGARAVSLSQIVAFLAEMLQAKCAERQNALMQPQGAEDMPLQKLSTQLVVLQIEA